MLITSLSRSAVLLGGVVFLGTAAMSPARAGGLSAAELSLADAVLSDFNVVTFGDYHATNETEGRVAVGGNFLGTGHNICFNGCAGDTTDTALGATYGALNVWGNVSGGATLLSGDAFIQGTNASGSNLSLQHNGGVNIVGQNSGQISNPTFINTAAPSAGTTQNAAAGTIKTGLPASAVFPFSATLPFQAALTDLS
ncbi:MAG: collagen-binding domain-containing protein, partial [Acidibrevibacterium sp.]|uniref:collagen-binding domain-containing protein n=1 Tax=Acidibrevibacterium sp. TaxID=2606776 RepID=UPI003D01F707